MSVQDLSSRLAALTPAQRALFEKARQEKERRRAAPAPETPAGPAVTPRPRSGPIPLSVDQERLWFIQQLTPASPAYNVYGADRLRGPLDVAVMTRALNELVRRHEVLRTTFPVVAGRPVQSIARHLSIRIPVVDLRSLPEERREAAADRAASQAVSVPFDLRKLPLLRLVLVRVADEDHVSAIAIHHIVTDWISYYAMAGELATLYGAFLEGRPSPLPELAVQFADFAVWQRERLADETWMAEQLTWWRERLTGAPDLLPLPYDRPRPPVQTPWGARRRLTLTRAQSDAFRAFAQREGGTLFIAGLAAFQVLLMRLSGDEKLIVGTPSAGRQGPEMQSVLGFFLNQIALFSDLSGNPPFREALRRVRDVSLGAYAHADVPFARVIEELRPDRDLSRTPLIQIIFLLLNFHELERPPMPGIEAEAYWVDAKRTAWDMTFSLWEQPDGLTGWMEYNTDLFDASTIDRMKEQFRTVVAGLLADPDARIWDLPLLPEPQRQQLLCEWAAGPGAPEPAATASWLFEAQAARTPEAVAVRSGDLQVSYGELARRAGAVAQRLRRFGVGPESVVGVCVERSPAMLAALLGVWKAGGAYLPLDPSYPEERLAWLLADSGAATLVAGPAEAARLGSALPVVDPHHPGPAGTADPASPANLAYILYTSGSTGRPKGVQVPHAALVNFLGSMAERPGLGVGDRLLAVTTISFDIAGLELYLPLLVGAEVVLADLETAADGSRLLAEIAASGATVMQATPVTWRLLLAAGWQGGGLRVWCGGEALPLDLAGELRRRAPEVWNLYGPTETTVWSATHRVEAGEEGTSGTVPIGAAIAATRLYVLDPYLAPAPAGVAGELVIGGAGLARGYRGRPELTAERFVPDPFGPAGERLYRTGDLARWLPSGRIEFLGRLDQQVKVRGFRVEPAEIERALEAHPGVAQAVVLARGDRPGERHLAAYVVAADDLGDWRGFLRQRLPEYMVPSALVTLDALPLTPNGKLDRRALARIEAQEDGRTGAAVRRIARTALGEVVAAVFAEVLGRPEVGPDDDFFQLGGHSLSAFQVVARLRDALDVELPVSALFARPTADGLAADVEARLGLAGDEVPPLVPLPRADGAPLSFAQQRLWFLDRLVPENPFYNMFFAVRIAGPLAGAALAEALSTIARRHEVLRTRFVEPEGKGLPVQQVMDTGLPLPVLDLSGLPAEIRGSELARLSTTEARRPFDLSRAPLVRATLVRLGDEEHGLFLSLHHIVSDGWSMRVLAGELGALYGGQALPPPPVQYADYAAWQRSWLSGPVLQRQLDYWRGQLAGAPPLLELPLDHPRPQAGGFRGGAETLSLSGALADGLRALAARQGATLFMAMLAAWKVLLARYSGQRDVLVGAPIANRTRREVEGLIGLFVNTLVLRTGLDGDPAGSELLERVKRTALGAFSHQHVPFERLVEELSPQRDLGHNPLAQVMFSMQTFPQATPDLGGLAVTALGGATVDAGTSKFDFTLFVWDVESAEDDELRLLLEYDSDLFDPSTVRRLLGHYETLLGALVADPAISVSRLPLLPAAERAEILAQGAAVRTDFGPRACLHERFLAWAAERPGAPAVTFEGETLTYGELARRAGRLARRLRDLGVGPETRVALRFERGLDLVTAILGVLEAGGAYVPLDPSLPAERLDFILADSGAAVLLDRLEDGGEKIEPPAAGLSPENTAYVIYTSGSTGRPKGVAVSHAAVDRLLAATRPWFGFGPDDVWTLFHSHAFDFSVWELWGALAHGGRLVVVPHLVSRSPEAFHDLLAAEKVTVLNQTPSAFYQLIRIDEERETSRLSLRWVIFGGEALDTARLAPWFERHGDESPRLVNMYGITETTVHVTWRPLSAADAGSPIGIPIPDLSAHVLDADLEPVPWGVPGELCVGGAGVARGYPGRPELTAERFVPDPFAGEPGARLYRSGDLVRRAGSDLEYLGRIDQQVKIRGFRIEPGEIESLLAQHPAVSAAAVLARTDGGEERRLVAYVVAGRERLPELRDHLAARLPEYMLPAAWVALDALPLTSNGKVDRAALPAPAGERPDLATGYAAPRSFAEEALAAVWAQVLGLDRVGVHDNFFALGGDSIRSLQVLSLARERGLHLELADLFRHQTIAGLAGVATAGGAAEETRTRPFELVSDENRQRLPEGLVDAYPLTLLQAGMLFHMQATADYPLYHNVDSRSAKLPLDLAALQAAFDRAVARHPVLRTSFDLTAYSEPLQLVHETAEMRVGVDDLRHLPLAERESRLAAFVQAEKRRLFDLSRPPLVRFHVHRLTDEWLQLTLTECHPIFDGWSLNSTLVEVFHDYLTALQGGTPAEPPPLRATFRDYVALERQALASAGQRDFWRGKVAAGPVTDLPPRFYPRADPLSGERGPRSQVRAELPEEVHAGLLRLARAAGVPVKSVCLAAHLRVLSLVTGQSDPLTGFILNGRPETVDGYEVRGLFLNTVPLRLRLDGGTWVELARAAFDAERELFPHRRYPLAALQQWWGREPLLQSAFNFTHFYVWGQIRALGWAIETGEGFNLELEENHYPLMVNFNYEEILSRLRVTIESQMEAGEAETLLAYYRRVLEAMAADPEGRYDEAGLIPAAELRPLLGEWSGVPVSDAVPLPVRFAEQAARTPDRVAVVGGEELLTYGELDRRSSRLARRLRAAGVGPEVRVAVALERRPELVVALLAVLRAGGAYLPLDLSHPEERRAGIVADSGALPLESLVGFGEDGEPLPEPDPRSLAYVIYTSGSTGRPKGVGIEHRGAAALIEWAGSAFAAEELEGVLAATSVGFDLSVFELFVPLCHGGTVFLAENALALSDLPARDAVTLVNTVPSAAAELVRAGALPRSVRTLCLAGEALRGALVRQVWERSGVERVWNLYGPSEDTTYSTGALLERGLAGEPPIGRPVAGSRAWVLDAGLHPLPAGVPGELCLGGMGVARGYLGSPEANAERFVPDPFSGLPGARLYRTGDLVRHRLEGLEAPDGQLEFLGRIDRQVKVRGVRIEPGEVEAALLAHPEVREAAVAVREESGPGGETERVLVAYVAPQTQDAAGLRAFLRGRLPEAMVPRRVVPLAGLPLTPNGKIDRRALAAIEPQADGTLQKTHAAPTTELEQAIAAVWSEMLGRERVDLHDNFFDLGGHSLLLLRVQARLRQALGRDVGVVDLFRHPTVGSLAAALKGRPGTVPAARPAAEAAPADTRIAIIGMAGRFPGAADVEELWRNLCAGVESIRRLSDADLDAAGVDPETRRDPRYVRASGVLDGVDLFDADFFGYVPRDAEVTDPQHRLFLEHAWQAMEHAGYVPGGAVGVFAGTGMSTYLRNLLTHPELPRTVGSLKLGIANDKDHLPTTVSYKLDLKGPSVAVQTACSTSLVAVHMACRSLLAGECDMALAGGASVPVPQGIGYLYQEGGILSPDGHCRTFDARARGSVGGSGVGVVVLKRLADALADGDTVHAVILGSAINNDGSLKVGYTAPGVEGQAGVIAAALAAARVDPRTVTYVEAHGTATPLGDPIEVAALTQAFRAADAEERGFCALGSIKSNVGHLDAAAGVAGLIKTALALERRMLPPILHFEAPNPEIDFASSPFRVNDRLTPWEVDGGPRRAGVSSFGLGGTNAHVVLEEPPAVERSGEASRARQVLPLSARTPAALERMAADLRRYLQSPAADLADIAFTLQVGRRAFPHRRAVVCRTAAEAAALLAADASVPSGNGSVEAALARQWVEGGEVDWSVLHQGERRRRVPLPTYPFERRRFWIDPAPVAADGRELPSGDPADWFHLPTWTRLPLPRTVPPKTDGAPWLVFLDGAGLGEQLLDRLGVEAVTVRPGERLAREGERRWTIDPRRREDYDALLAGLERLPARVLHLWGLDPLPEGRTDDLGLVSLLFLLQAAGERPGSTREAELTVVTRGAQGVTGGDLTDPGKATVLGIVRTAPAEIPGLTCRLVDVSLPVPLEKLAAEVLSGSAETVAAWRNGERWVQRFERLRLETGPLPSGDGAWLITGGFGGIGLALAEHLAATGRGRLVLIGRSGPPPEDDPRAGRLRRLTESAEVLALAADVTDPAALRDAAARAVERFGRVAGVIHAAGVPGGGLITLRTPSELEAEMSAKVRGATALGEVCREIAPEVLVLVSSVSSFAGNLGQTGYVAANSFLDTWGRWYAETTGQPTLVLNWGRWRGVGMAAEAERRHRRMTGEELAGGMPVEQAVATFDRALASGFQQLVVSDLDPAALTRAARSAGPAVQETRPVHARPDLFTPYVEPQDDLEREIAALWQEAFGIDRIGVRDSFFELGGDSLFALRLVDRIGQAFGVDLRVHHLFAAPTVEGLAATVTEAMLAGAAPEELDRAFGEMGEAG